MTKKSDADLTLLDQRLVKALSHPTRAHALTVCTHRPASPKEIAAELDRDINHVSYHINELVKLECVELVDTKKRRNADEHFYKATVRHYFDTEAWERVPQQDRLKLRIDLIKMISSEMEAAARAATLDTEDNHISRVAMKLDEQGCGELVSRLAETLEDVLAIKERAALRLGKSDEPAVETRVNIIHFELPATGSHAGP